MINTVQIGMGWFPEQAGGLNRFFYDCVHHLPTAGIDIHGLVAGPDEVIEESNGQVRSFAPRNTSLVKRWYGVREQLQTVLNQRDIPLVVSHFALYALPVLDLLDSRPLVTHFHGPWAMECGVEGNPSLSTCFKKAMEKWPYRRSDRFIVLSKAFQTILHEEYHVPLDRIHIVPGGVDTERFSRAIAPQSARQQLDWPDDRFILFSVRRLAKRMGLEHLIAAIATLRHSYPNLLLYIAGKGALREQLQAQIDDLDLNHHVKLLGYVAEDDLPLAYQAADLTVVPTVALEGFGLTITESLASGTPVMGTPVGGIPEILRPLSDDLVFDDASTQALTEGLRQVLLGQRRLPDRPTCRRYAESHYAWPVIAEQIKSVYQSALAKL